MTTEDKMLYMFEQIEGKLTGSYSAVVGPIDINSNTNLPTEERDAVVHCMKDGQSCWYMTREKLLFNYITRDLDPAKPASVSETPCIGLNVLCKKSLTELCHLQKLVSEVIVNKLEANAVSNPPWDEE